MKFYKDKQKKTGYKPRCKSCEKLYKNYELRREYEKYYRLAHPEKRAEIAEKYYIKNKKSFSIIQRGYRSTLGFKIKSKLHGAIRRARLKNAFIENVDYYDIYLKSDKRCEYCGMFLKFKKVEFDHFIPLSKGGLHKKENIKISCSTCNRKKGAKLPKGVTYQVV